MGLFSRRSRYDDTDDDSYLDGRDGYHGHHNRHMNDPVTAPGNTYSQPGVGHQGAYTNDPVHNHTGPGLTGHTGPTGTAVGPNTHYANDGYDRDGLGHGHKEYGYDQSHSRGRRGFGGLGGGLGGFGGRRGRNRVRKSNTGMGGRKEKRALFDLNSGNFNRRPGFGQWLKMTVLDIVTMIVMGAIGLGVYMADPAPSRSFPITFNGSGDVVYPEFAYPLRKEIIPIWAAALMAALIPIAVFLICQIRIRSFWDINNAVIGLLYSLISAAVFQVFIKWLIGGLRPHFLYVCAPDMSRVRSEGGQGFQRLMFQRDICTGDQNQINDSLESMPSGHSTAAFAGFIFLYLYLNAKLKVFANYHPAMWKLIAVYAPVLGACLIAGALTIDEFHNWYDCLAGAVIGTIMAFSSYRMVYASVWDFRFNHIPLTRHTPFSYGAGEAGAGGFEGAVFTRKAGWGFDEAYGGAPFDAAHHLRGAMAGFNNTVHQNGHGHGHGHGGIMGGRHSHTNNHRDGDIEHNAVVAPGHHTTTGTTTGTHMGTGTHVGPTTHTETTHMPGTSPSPNRYRTHRKSLERKSLPAQPREPEYAAQPGTYAGQPATRL